MGAERRPSVVSRLTDRLRPLLPSGPPLAPGALSKRQLAIPLVAGASAGCAAALVSLFLRFTGAGVFVPEEGVDWVIEKIPGVLEAGAIAMFGGYAKVLSLAFAVTAFVLLHAFWAAYRPRVVAWQSERFVSMAIMALVPAAATLFVVLPFFGEGMAGADTTVGWVAAAGSVAAAELAFVLVLEFAVRDLTASHPDGIEVKKRTFLLAMASAFLFGSAAILAVSRFITTAGRLAFSSVSEMLSNEVTPNDAFYKVSKNVSDPIVNPSSYALGVDGLVDRPMQLSVNDLLGRPQASQYMTLECVSNPVGGGLISNAYWTGIPLAGLLLEAGAQASGTWVLFTCADDYTVAVPAWRARLPASLIALRMNGERLPVSHGYPARILVPGVYGMFQAKWVRRISVVDHEVMGYWQQKGWTNEGEIRPTAIIAVVPTAARVGNVSQLGGVAFAGDRRITRVEVSDDGGSTWADATLYAPLSPQAWTMWSFDWTPGRAGDAQLAARCWVEQVSGPTVQTAARAGSYPSGAQGYDELPVRVSD